ncbi:ABC transporter substrate-binding protein [Roseibium sp. SCP14]|uniref:ABC transporter substrate-binding protein n=1 Tax=Roseibium sp. SCP14 TaxID=3141375 RepID=UPI00333AE8FB
MTISRRNFLKTTAVAGSALASPVYLRRAWADEPLVVGSFGGYFEDSIREKVLPKFTEATGIPSRSVPTSSGTSYYAGIRPAVAAGDPPIDVGMTGGGEIIRFADIFHRFDPSNVPNVKNLGDKFVARGKDEKPYATAVLSWYSTFVQNTDYFPDPIKSWAEIWDSNFSNSLGWTEDITISGLLEITQATHFAGEHLLATREGARELMLKIAELKENVTLWYRDEGQFQQGLQSGEIPAGQYYHDVTQIMIADGFPVISVFPKEGGVIDFGSWGILKGSPRTDAAEQFLNYCCDPQVQGDMSRAIGTAPVVSQQAAGMSDEEFAAVSSPIPPIFVDYDFQVREADWTTEEWAKILSGA